MLPGSTNVPDTPCSISSGLPPTSEAHALTKIIANLAPDVLNDWLVQAYALTKGVATYQAVAAARTPRPAQSLLIVGLSDHDQQLSFFEQIALALDIELNTDPSPRCRRYTDYLIASAYTKPFEVLLAITYGIEISCLDAWNTSRTAGPYAELIRRWRSRGRG